MKFEGTARSLLLVIVQASSVSGYSEPVGIQPGHGTLSITKRNGEMAI